MGNKTGHLGTDRDQFLGLTPNVEIDPLSTLKCDIQDSYQALLVEILIPFKIYILMRPISTSHNISFFNFDKIIFLCCLPPPLSTFSD